MSWYRRCSTRDGADTKIGRWPAPQPQRRSEACSFRRIALWQLGASDGNWTRLLTADVAFTGVASCRLLGAYCQSYGMPLFCLGRLLRNARKTRPSAGGLREVLFREALSNIGCRQQEHPCGVVAWCGTHKRQPCNFASLLSFQWNTSQVVNNGELSATCHIALYVTAKVWSLQSRNGKQRSKALHVPLQALRAMVIKVVKAVLSRVLCNR